MYAFAKSPQASLSRRKFLGASLAGTAASLLGATASTFIAPEPALAQSILLLTKPSRHSSMAMDAS